MQLSNPSPLALKGLGHKRRYLLGKLDRRVGLSSQGHKDARAVQSCQSDMWPFGSAASVINSVASQSNR